MVVECYLDKIEQKMWLTRENDDFLFNVCEEVALAPTVPRVNRWNRINRWNRNAPMTAATRDYLSGKEVEC